MDTIQIKAERRTLGSKGKLNQMRQEGKIPAVLHNHGGESVHLTIGAADIKRAITTSAGMNALLSLDYEGEKQLAMIETIERDPLKAGTYVHANLTRISMEGPIDVRVPIVIVGQEKRAVSNGIVSLLMHEILITTSPNGIPEHFTLDVATMDVGDTIMVKDLKMPEGCTTAASPEDLVLHVIQQKGAETTDLPEAAAEDETEA